MSRPSRPAPDLDGYRVYLSRFGLAEETIDIYAHQMKRAFEQGGPVERLRTDLAPKTQRLVRAAARHWATYVGDPALRQSLDELRLPSPRRKTAKVPLDLDTLLRLMKEVEVDPALSPAMRSVLGMMAFRGFRDGDVLRMKRTEITTALRGGTLTYEAKGKRYLEFKVLRTYRKWLEALAAIPGWTRVDELIAKSPTPKSRRRRASRNVQRTLKRLGKRLGIEDLYPHRLRRTYAVEFLRAQRNDPEAVIKLTQHMQWASMATAMQYVDHVRTDGDDVAEGMFDRKER